MSLVPTENLRFARALDLPEPAETVESKPRITSTSLSSIRQLYAVKATHHANTCPLPSEFITIDQNGQGEWPAWFAAHLVGCARCQQWHRALKRKRKNSNV
jgi:hypothetical protein